MKKIKKRKYKQYCKFCGYKWLGRKKVVSACPRCHQRFDNIKRIDLLKMLEDAQPGRCYHKFMKFGFKGKLKCIYCGSIIRGYK